MVKDPKGCTAEAIVLVWVEGVRKAYIPNAFSPNGDGSNDSFTVFGGDDIKTVKYLRVFDASGTMLFEATDFAPNTPDLGWDGTFRGKDLDIQRLVFSSDIEYTNGQILHREGDVMIVR
jgi:gliding motility-associated-like protein